MASKTLCIACGVFRSDLDALIAAGAVDADTVFLEGGLHGEPDRLRRELQAAIDAAEDGVGRAGFPEQIVILYGLCGRGIAGIKARSLPLVLPKVHDCISLFMGGADAYRKQFAAAPGTYYISAGWYEEQVQTLEGRRDIVYPEACMGDSTNKNLAERFGRENAGNISEFLDSWKRNYTRCVYIDTGSPDDGRYRSHARSLAEENGWSFEEFKGSREMILRCFNAKEGDELCASVAPGHEIYHDTGSGTFSSAPLGQAESLKRDETIFLPGAGTLEGRTHSIGLGVDAGGTYTDAVIYDFRTETVLAKAKALTTRWRYSEGISEAVRRLPGELIARVELVSVSTTLVTNAIVESRRRPVGLLLMPNGSDVPEGPKGIPTSVIRGRTSISGEITEVLDENEVRSTAAAMAKRHHLEAFAVSGYGASRNPELELRVKEIIQEETGADVCCGHEMSGRLNFPIRAATAVLNAGVIPIMEDFLAEMAHALEKLGIDAPMLVVRGDGTVMNQDFAKTFPVQAALSGPAASMAGAMFLTGLKDAAVVDVGGTTSDIGFLEKGRVAIRSDGARIGDWDTHVEAVDMLTIGLGGDSEIVYERGDWSVGPRRISPICRLFVDGIEGFHDKNAAGRRGFQDALDEASKNVSRWRGSIRPLQVLERTGKEPDFILSARERLIWDALESGPMMLWQIAEATGLVSWKLLHTARLEDSWCLQRSGATPTDLFCRDGRLSGAGMTWDRELAVSYWSMIVRAAAMDAESLSPHIGDMIARKLGSGFLRKILGEDTEASPWTGTILEGGNRLLSLRPAMEIPLVGLGAPAGLIADDAAGRLGTRLTLCGNSDVANAVGAVTSRINVRRRAEVAPTASGSFRIHGLKGEDRHFESLEEAEKRCLEVLADAVRVLARKAGTSADDVEVEIDTDAALSAEGSELFVRRTYEASVNGLPDLV